MLRFACTASGKKRFTAEPRRAQRINHPAASSGVLKLIRHAGLDPASSPLFSGFRLSRNDGMRGKPQGIEPAENKVLFMFR